MPMMKVWNPMVILLSCVLLTMGLGTAYSKRSDGAAPISWQDVQGRAYSRADFTRHKATVFLFTSTQCPVANLYTPRMIDMARDYSPRGVQFFLVDSNREDSLAAVQRYAKERAFPFPTVKDNGTALADRLGAQATPEAIVLDKTGTIRYLGRIDDNQDRTKVVHSDVREALDAVLAGKPVARARTLTVGCAIFRDTPTVLKASADAGAPVTYTRDVAPILNANCVACHRTGEVAPFSLETYQQAHTWARPIKDYTARRLMPPWKPAAGIGDFHDARALTAAQITTLARWADAGGPEGDLKDLPPAPQFPPPGQWTLGTPDMVLQAVRPYHLAAEGKDVYRNFVLPVDFKENRYLRGIEFKPDNRAVVHHIVTYFDPTGKSAQMDGHETEPGYTVPGVGIGVEPAIWGEVWIPGSRARFMPPGVVIKIPAGAKLVMQVHYHKDGKPETDHSQMALYFAKGKIEKPIHVFALGTFELALKPDSSQDMVHCSFTLPIDAHLWSIFPHMHMLGHAMTVKATFPDGKVTPLIRIDDWDFNWQATYFYKEPILLPKGTKLDLEAVYDNSERNPRQTSHPPKLVRFGEQTTDEMCFCFLGVTLDRENLAAQPSGAPASP